MRNKLIAWKPTGNAVNKLSIKNNVTWEYNPRITTHHLPSLIKVDAPFTVLLFLKVSHNTHTRKCSSIF